MKSPKRAGSELVIIVLLIFAVAACVVRPEAHRPSPPPPIEEVRPKPPSPKHHWVPGYYRWKGGKGGHYVWMKGRYQK